MYVTIQRMIESQKVWMQLDDGIEIAQTYYQSPTWDKAQKINNGKPEGIKAA